MNSHIYSYLFIYILAVSLIAFCMCGADKRRAKLNRWRVPEATMLISGLLGGCFGLLLGMRIFHHKTKHLKFTILVPLECLLWTIGLAYPAISRLLAR